MVSEVEFGGVAAAGVESLVGDAVVAAVVLKPNIDSYVSLESDVGDDGMVVWLVHRRVGKLASIIVHNSTQSSEMEYIPGIAPDGLTAYMGDSFSAAVELTAFARVAGFLPRTPEAIFNGIEAARAGLERVLSLKYPNILASRIRKIDSPVASDEAGMIIQDLWAHRKPSLVISDEAFHNMPHSRRLRMVASYLVAERIARGVCAARMADLDAIYPSLQLMENGGYGDDNMYRGLRQFYSYTRAGLRSDIIKHWISWRDGAPSGVPTAVPADDGEPQVTRDNLGREVIQFSRASAQTWLSKIEALQAKGKRLPDWDTQFVSSIKAQLGSGKRLSPRQMFVLYQKVKHTT